VHGQRRNQDRQCSDVPVTCVTADAMQISMLHAPSADQLCVHRSGGDLRLSARVGDTRPMQMLDVRVRMYLYRWSRPGASRANLLDAAEPFQMQVASF
jgi:hypothetical protein